MQSKFESWAAAIFISTLFFSPRSSYNLDFNNRNFKKAKKSYHYKAILHTNDNEHLIKRKSSY